MKFKSPVAVLAVLALVLPGTGLRAQDDAAAKLLALHGNGVIPLIAYDKDRTEIARGAAIVLSETTAVTTYHLISKAAKVEGFNLKKKKVDVDGILGIDKALDLVLLQIDGKVTPLTLGGAALVADLPVIALGANELGDLSAASGKIRKLFDLAPNVKVADSTLTVADQFDGGAVLDETGKVVGLLNVQDKRLRFVVPAGALNTVSKGKLIAFKNWIPEDYFATVEASWLSGRMFLWTDEVYAAQRGLERVTKAQPSNLEAWTMLASVYDRQRDYNNAIGAYQKIAELDPQNADAYAGLGQVQSRMQKHEEAVANLEKALKLNPALVVPLQFLGNSYEGLHQWVKAGDAYDRYLASHPVDAAQIYRMLANCREKAEQFEASAAAYAEALKIDPTNVFQYYQMSQMLEKAKKYEEAEAAYIKTGEVSKDPGKYFPNIIAMYDAANMTENAIAAIRKQIEINPNNEQAHYNLGFMLQRTQKFAEAIAAYQKAVAVKPTYDYAWFQIGYCYYNLKNYSQAIEAFKKNVEITPDHFYGWMYLGMCRMQLKQYAPALDYMKKALDIQGDNTDALMNLGIIYLNLRDKYSAQEVVKKLQTLDAAKAAKLKSYIK